MIEVVTGPTTFSSSGTIVPLTQVAQGLDYANNRVGDSIKLQRLEMRFKFQIAAAATRTAVRCIVFRDLDNQGSGPFLTDILGTSGGSATTCLYPKSYLNADRFSFLYDELLHLDITNNQMDTFVFDIPHEGHVKYLGTTAATASNGKGSVYVAFISDEGTTLPSYAFHSRVYFTDD